MFYLTLRFFFKPNCPFLETSHSTNLNQATWTTPKQPTWIKLGRQGSVHDNRVWSNSEIYLGRDKYFDQKEYLLGDSAFSTS